MRTKKLYAVITFATTTDAMAMEKQCTQLGLPGRIIPVPREITANCGLAWRIGADEYEACRPRLEALGLQFEKVTMLTL